jgi:hypothetical protein
MSFILLNIPCMAGGYGFDDQDNNNPVDASAGHGAGGGQSVLSLMSCLKLILKES